MLNMLTSASTCPCEFLSLSGNGLIGVKVRLLIKGLQRRLLTAQNSHQKACCSSQSTVRESVVSQKAEGRGGDLQDRRALNWVISLRVSSDKELVRTGRV